MSVTAPLQPTRLYVAAPDDVALLEQELAASFPTGRHTRLTDRLVASTLDAADSERCVAVAFAAQCLTQPRLQQAESVSQHAAALFAAIDEAFADDAVVPWRLHLYSLDAPQPRTRRAQLIGDALDELLAKRRRSLRRQRVVDASAPMGPNEAVVQLALVSPTLGWLSVTPATARFPVRRVLSRFVGGLAPEPTWDQRPPSRAYLKLVESLAHMGTSFRPEETCVDLGGSPGGWTFVALDQGAHVTAVDRSALDASVMEHPACSFVRGDAFRYAPAEPVDWLLCDVIATPDKNLALLDRWLGERWCRRFLVTLKFKGEPSMAILLSAKQMLERHGVAYALRRLQANKNEVSIFGEVSP